MITEVDIVYFGRALESDDDEDWYLDDRAGEFYFLQMINFRLKAGLHNITNIYTTLQRCPS